LFTLCFTFVLYARGRLGVFHSGTECA
jgi:hypothetical protein